MVARASQEARRAHHHPPRSLPRLPKEADVEDAAVMFRALGDAARLRLLAILVHGEICVSELAAMEKEKVTTISARLRSLYSARLVKRRREAKHVFYSVSDEHVVQMVRGAIDHAAERN